MRSPSSLRPITCGTITRPLRSSENMGKVDRGNESCSIFWTFTVDMGPT